MPAKLCECGCGKPAPIAKQTDPRDGHIAGQPVRFIRGHNGRRPLVERFAEKITPAMDASPNGMLGCILWGRGENYGTIYDAGRMLKAHSVAWALAGYEIPTGHELDHLCRRPACVNPAHLEPVTHAVNSQRGPHARLTAAQASMVRRLCRDGWLGTDVAAAFGVHRNTVYAIATGRTWINA